MKQYGFTLVELLVVISIIAILAAVSIGVFSSAQASGRDSKRRAEINSIGVALESSRDFGTGYYVYSVTGQTDFPAGFPDDPTGTAARRYCIATSTTSTTPPTKATSNAVIPETAAAVPANAGCPTTGDGTYARIIAGYSLPANTKSWVVCATLERGTAFCEQSVAR